MEGELQLETPSEQQIPSDSDPLLENQTNSSEIVIKDEEIEASSVVCCRICLESDCDQGDELISPCMCKGTQQFVHRSCLDHWRSIKVKN
ncbi:hypothetical protein GIB67_043151 [Kingdonia uniflora]|uniref:RING-CH-type domain-containing protein n=1 Tax=Kingdonia uniflora TaxID=39325 RepID=A0A7J7NJW8_9MAGN|nr:hypothetical protein GIB67_043151 [Kingdonia uniflora]